MIREELMKSGCKKRRWTEQREHSSQQVTGNALAVNVYDGLVWSLTDDLDMVIKEPPARSIGTAGEARVDSMAFRIHLMLFWKIHS